MVGEPVRLPPPPFWRTAYFANEVMSRQDRVRITAEMILDVLAMPVRTQRQADGRYQHWVVAGPRSLAPGRHTGRRRDGA